MSTSRGIVSPHRERLVIDSLVFTVFFCYISILIIQSFFTPEKFAGDDSAVFATMGHAWLEGAVPYKDLFDHKGPLLYLVNAAGFLLLGDDMGILLVEIFFVCLWLGVVFWLFDEKRVSGSVVLLFCGIAIFRSALDRGNCPEEYAILFGIISVAFYCRKSTPVYGRFLIHGVMGACAFLLRPNLAIVPFLIFLFDLFDGDNLKSACKQTLVCGLGFLAMCAPFLAYFYSKGALGHLYDAYFTFNVDYTVDGNGIEAVFRASVSQIFLYFPFYAVCFGCFIYTVFLSENTRRVGIQSGILLVVTLLMSEMSARGFRHYNLMLIPAYIYVLYTFVMAMSNNFPELAGFGRLQREVSRLKTLFVQTSRVTGYTVLFVCIAAVNGYLGVRIYKRLSSDKKARVVAYLDSLGFSGDASVLNVGDHTGTKIFTIYRIVPDQRVFFPGTANPDAGTTRDILRNIKALAETKRYNFILSRHPIELPTYDLVGRQFFHYIYRRDGPLDRR